VSLSGLIHFFCIGEKRGEKRSLYHNILGHNMVLGIVERKGRKREEKREYILNLTHV